jgi:hypothetical protein
MGKLFQLWLIHGMALLAVLLAGMWLWGGVIAEAFGQLVFVALAPLLLLAAAWFVRRAYAPKGQFIGWRRLLGRAPPARPGRAA